MEIQTDFLGGQKNSAFSSNKSKIPRKEIYSKLSENSNLKSNLKTEISLGTKNEKELESEDATNYIKEESKSVKPKRMAYSQMLDTIGKSNYLFKISPLDGTCL